jgi:hypothetical protein
VLKSITFLPQNLPARPSVKSTKYKDKYIRTVRCAMWLVAWAKFTHYCGPHNVQTRFGERAVLILPTTLRPSASNRNEYQEYILEGKGGPCAELTIKPPSCTTCLQILRASTSWRPKGLSKPAQGLLLNTGYNK